MQLFSHVCLRHVHPIAVRHISVISSNSMVEGDKENKPNGTGKRATLVLGERNGVGHFFVYSHRRPDIDADRRVFSARGADF